MRYKIGGTKRENSRFMARHTIIYFMDLILTRQRFVLEWIVYPVGASLEQITF